MTGEIIKALRIDVGSEYIWYEFDVDVEDDSLRRFIEAKHPNALNADSFRVRVFREVKSGKEYRSSPELLNKVC